MTLLEFLFDWVQVFWQNDGTNTIVVGHFSPVDVQ